MGFDSLGRYSPTHKSWDHVGNMIPVVEHSEGVRPHGEFKPAAWLPVKFFDKYYEEYFVVMPGKVLAFDNDGRVCPAQYGLAGASITYSTNDVTAGTISAATGVPVTAAEVAGGAINVADVTSFLGGGSAMAVSAPVGVAPYAYWQWAGDSSSLDDGFNPSAYRQHNHNLQHRVAILCDYVLELPLVPANTAAEAAVFGTYDVGGSDLLVLAALSNTATLAADTQRSRVTFAGTAPAVAALFLVRVDTLAEVDAEGEWHLDQATGVITLFTTTSLDAAGVNGGKLTVNYYHYGAAVTGASVFAAASGNLKAGDFVKCDAESNFVLANPDPSDAADLDAAADALLTRGNIGDTFASIVGQVIELENANKDALDMVKTAYNPPLGTDASGSSPGYAGQMDQMPGSATGGVSDKVHYAGAADLVVRINLVSR